MGDPRSKTVKEQDEELVDEAIEFWKLIERTIGCTVPLYLKNLLKSQGFDNVLAIKNIDQDDIEFLEKFARTQAYVNSKDKDVDLYKYLGTYRDSQSDFQILREHKKMLAEIVQRISAESLKGTFSTYIKNVKQHNPRQNQEKQQSKKETASQISIDINKEHDVIYKKIKEWFKTFISSMASMNMKINENHKKICLNMSPDMVVMKPNFGLDGCLQQVPVAANAFCPICKKIQSIGYTSSGWSLSNFTRHMKMQHWKNEASVGRSPKSSQETLHFYSDKSCNDSISDVRQYSSKEKILEETSLKRQSSYNVITDDSSSEFLPSQPKKKLRSNVIVDDEEDILDVTEVDTNKENVPNSGELQTGELTRESSPVLNN